MPTRHVGDFLYVVVHDLGDGDIVSDPFGPIEAARPVNQTLPTVTGDAIMYGTLTGEVGTWAPEADSYSYRWFRCDTEGDTCVEIEDIVDTTYQLGQKWWDGGADVGTRIRFQVTAHNDGGDTVAQSAATAVIPAPVLGVAGDPVTGSDLTFTWTGGDFEHAGYDYYWCSAGGARNLEDLSEHCQWDGQGTAPDGFTVPSGHVGQYLYFVAKSRYISEPFGPIAPAPPANLARPTISGAAHTGRTLTANRGTWSDASTYTYQWARCAVACSDVVNATSSTFTLGDVDFGSKLRVTVTATGSGGSTPATSAQTSAVSGDEPTNTVAPSIAGTARDGEVLTAAAGTWTGTGAANFAYSYQWYRCAETCVSIDGADRTTYTLGPDDVGTSIEVVVTAVGAAGTNDASSATTDPVTGIVPNGLAPTITGIARVGETLTATNGSWTGTPPLLMTNQWMRCEVVKIGNPPDLDCTPIADANGTTYTLGTDDIGTVVVTRVTVTGPGGTASRDSDPTAAVVALPSGGLGSSVTTDGATITVSGHDFAPDSDVDVVLHSDPVHLGTAHTDANGHFTATFAIPAGTPAGAHHIVLTGLDAVGLAAIVELPVTVNAATPTDPAAPTTPAVPANAAPETPAAPANAAPSNPTTGTGLLPVTGSRVGPLVTLALAGVAVGGACVAGSRRRRN